MARRDRNGRKAEKKDAKGQTKLAAGCALKRQKYNETYPNGNAPRCKKAIGIANRNPHNRRAPRPRRANYFSFLTRVYYLDDFRVISIPLRMAFFTLVSVFRLRITV